MAVRWIIDRAGSYFSLSRPNRIVSANDSVEEERSLNYLFQDPTLEANPRSLISVLGTMPANLVEILDTTVKACRGNTEFPIVVLSELRVDLIAARSAPLEFLPTHRHLPSVPPENYGRYIRQRWALILAKWDISNEIALSSSIDEFLTDQIGENIVQQLTCEQSRHAKGGQREY
ncbi:hypothetical protein [Sinorhizobium americanum]|uniref:hypothetical protein n=1 Tax=Sinorhizobium americanum TaxID=194963 RepID=UPI0007D9E469|nr:hypothetical protein [Sinorhizobium americanum]OAP40327.1 hypothetical protein ATC00_20790 [Sinorhizobium americanum]